jgi:hypothetical protein
MPLTDSNLQAAPARSSSANLVSLLLLACSVLWCIYWFVHAWHYWEDDAFIHLEFARSVASGQGFAFNGHIVAGDTAPLWVLLLAAAHALIPDWLLAGKVLTIAGAIFGLSGIYAFARSLSGALLTGHKTLPAALLLLIVVNPYSSYWLFSGMEPITAAGLACFAVLAATRNQPSARSVLTACLLAGLGPLLRPEMFFLAALLALPIFGQFRRLPASASRFAVFALGLALLIAPLAIWSAYSLHAFGHILPNTNAAKRAAPDESVVHRLLNLYTLGFPVIVLGVLAGIAVLALRFNAVCRSLWQAGASAFAPASRAPSSGLPLSGWIFLLWPSIAAVFYVANHTYVQTRYILVPAPGLTIVIMLLALRSFPRAGRALYVLAMVAALVVSTVMVRPLIRNKGISCMDVRNLALFIRDHTPADAPVAAYAIGEVAFVSQHPLIDTGGITRPGAIPYLNDPIQVMGRWAQSQGAQYYIESRPPLPGAQEVYSIRSPYAGWSFHPASYFKTYTYGLWKLPPPAAPGPTPQTPSAHP